MLACCRDKSSGVIISAFTIMLMKRIFRPGIRDHDLLKNIFREITPHKRCVTGGYAAFRPVVDEFDIIAVLCWKNLIHRRLLLSPKTWE